MGSLSLIMFFLKKFCDLANNFLCNFDPHAYHYVLISIVKSIAFAWLIQNEGMNVKIPTTKDEFKLPFIAKTPVCFTRVPASLNNVCFRCYDLIIQPRQ